MWGTSISWDDVREGLKSTDTKIIRRSVVAVGKVLREHLPDDIADLVTGLFRHPDPEVRVEAVRAIGLHWCLPSVFPMIVDLLKSEEDWHVQLSAIDALGALGREHDSIRGSASQTLAGLALDERFAEDERVIAYRELLYVEGRTNLKQYRQPDPPLEDSLQRLEADRVWLQDRAASNCTSSAKPNG